MKYELCSHRPTPAHRGDRAGLFDGLTIGFVVTVQHVETRR